ncbi:TRAP transporter TatT component family protein [Halomonas saccharevitans]|uniref:TRAP transporter TatT component family protein n=1 Tax=Halomonas saccharevitans TaxID=416872 RepID=A0ABU3NF34_9GAMM|nr:TRAP transporter TatT component family protein [Halomonas saccharevitans]MDT8879789.1 TRAP transporter TatT component family protein [Halomonas saccharevitans]
MHRSSLSAIVLATLLGPGLLAASLAQAQAEPQAWDQEVGELRHRWERITTEMPEDRRESALESLSKESSALAEAYPRQGPVLVWRGIVLASHARAAGGLAALGSAKQAREVLERAVELDPEGHNGSAWVTLGALYDRAPGWPVAFGDEQTAERMFRRALSIRPEGIDVHYYYAAFLEEEGRRDEAREHARRAIDGTARATRPLSDEALRDDARALLARL